jgi:hypothetical protein
MVLHSFHRDFPWFSRVCHKVGWQKLLMLAQKINSWSHFAACAIVSSWNKNLRLDSWMLFWNHSDTCPFPNFTGSCACVATHWEEVRKEWLEARHASVKTPKNWGNCIWYTDYTP